jgi:hypothetical protein
MNETSAPTDRRPPAPRAPRGAVRSSRGARSRPRDAFGRCARVALLACAIVVAGCAAPSVVVESDALRERISRGDLAGADALLVARSDRLDARRALDLAIRVGRVDAARHFLPRAGADAELDLDGTTPLIPRRPRRAAHRSRPARRAAARGRRAARSRRPLRPQRARLRDGAQPRRAVRRSAGRGPGRRRSPRGWARRAWRRAPPRPSPRGPRPRPTRARTDARPRAAGGPPPAAAVVRAGGSAASRTPAAAPRTVTTVDVATLMRQSPWAPAIDGAAAGADRVALRFHADGSPTCCTVDPAARLSPMSGASGAWRVEADRLMVSIVSDAFVVACAGSLRADGTLRLGCEERDARRRGCCPPRASTWPARCCRTSDPAAGPRCSRSPPRGPGRRATCPRRPGPSPCVRATRPRSPASAPSAACRPAAHRTPVPAAVTTRLGDWYGVSHAKRFEAIAPLSGRMCAQTVARDAAHRRLQRPRVPQRRRMPGGPGLGAGGPARRRVRLGRLRAPTRRRRSTGALARLPLRPRLRLPARVAMSGRNVDTTPSGACAVSMR